MSQIDLKPTSLMRSLTKKNETQNQNFFFIADLKTCRLFSGFYLCRASVKELCCC